jgi:hypothetical protein
MSKKYIPQYLFVVCAFIVAPTVVYAVDLFGIMDILLSIILTIIPILLALAVLVFLWGIVKFIAHADDESTHEEGKQLMIWGMVGLFVMVGLWSIVGYIQQSIGLQSFGFLPALQQQGSTLPTPIAG